MFSQFVIEKKALRLKDMLFKKEDFQKQEVAAAEPQELSMRA